MRAIVVVMGRRGPPPVAPCPRLGLEKPRGPAACPAAYLVELCGRSSPPRCRSRVALPRRAPWPRASSTPRVRRRAIPEREGAAIRGGSAPPPVAPHRRRVVVGHAADASEPCEHVAWAGRAGGGRRGTGPKFLSLGRAGRVGRRLRSA
jgi:hypothetical protein